MGLNLSIYLKLGYVLLMLYKCYVVIMYCAFHMAKSNFGVIVYFVSGPYCCQGPGTEASSSCDGETAHIHQTPSMYGVKNHPL